MQRSAEIDLAAESRRLEADAERAAASRQLAGLRASRSNLPAASHRDAVLQRLAAHRVLVISGATGAPPPPPPPPTTMCTCTLLFNPQFNQNAVGTRPWDVKAVRRCDCVQTGIRLCCM